MWRNSSWLHFVLKFWSIIHKIVFRVFWCVNWKIKSQNINFHENNSRKCVRQHTNRNIAQPKTAKNLFFSYNLREPFKVAASTAIASTKFTPLCKKCWLHSGCNSQCCAHYTPLWNINRGTTRPRGVTPQIEPAHVNTHILMKLVSKFHPPSPSSLGGDSEKPPSGIKRFSFIDMYR